MLQASARYYLLLTPSGDVEATFSDEYHEPGFDIMYPLEFDYPKCDQFSVRIQKRADATGDTFSTIDSVDFSVIVKDPTTDQTVPYTLVDIGNRSLLLTITNSLTLIDPTVRVRIMDVYLKDTTDDDFIIFRILVNDDSKYFNYIFVDVNNMSDRSSVTAQGRDVYVRVAASGNYYMLISPYAYLKEKTLAESDFSYPLNTIFYKRQDSYSNEDYSFSISAYSHAFMKDVVSVMNVPSYGKAGVLLVDNRIYKDMIENGVNPYVKISVNGELSGNADIFKVNFMT